MRNLRTCGAVRRRRGWVVTASALALVALLLDAAPAAAVDTPIVINPMTIDFGTVAVGATTQKVVAVSNTGDDDFGPIIMFGGAIQTAAFGGSQGCQGRTLGPDQSCAVSYTFTPTARGRAAGTSSFIVSESDQQHGEQFSVALTGCGEGGVVVVSCGGAATADPGTDTGIDSTDPTTATTAAPDSPTTASGAEEPGGGASGGGASGGGASGGGASGGGASGGGAPATGNELVEPGVPVERGDVALRQQQQVDDESGTNPWLIALIAAAVLAAAGGFVVFAFRRRRPTRAG